MIDLRIKKLFFDRKAVISAVDRGTRKVLSKFGAFVRRTARGSIRKRSKPSPPGTPPSSHTGLLKKFIFFGYEPAKRSVVIGPARLSRKGQGEAPHLLEYGGLLRQGFAGQGRRSRKGSMRIRARPFMRPAFEKEQPKLSAMWRSSVR